MRKISFTAHNTQGHCIMAFDWVAKHIPEIAMTAAMAWGAGLRLYLVVFAVGLGGYLGWLPLPETMKLLSHPAVMGASGFMAFVEFFADKIPYLDSVWDAVHTFLRIPAGAALAAGMMGGNGEAISMVAAILGGTLAAGTHLSKAGTRAVVNTSPEPFSNVGTSLAEDSMVIGGLSCAPAQSSVGTLERGRGNKGERVRAEVLKLTLPFSISELEDACPGVSRDMVRLVLRAMKAEGLIAPTGKGRGARWLRSLGDGEINGGQTPWV